MEVKMEPIALADVPGMAKADRPHDAWARAAVEQFAEGDSEAVELYPPKFAVSVQTVRGLLAQYGNRHGVKVKSVRLGLGSDPGLLARHPGEGIALFLYRKGA